MCHFFLPCIHFHPPSSIFLHLLPCDVCHHFLPLHSMPSMKNFCFRHLLWCLSSTTCYNFKLWCLPCEISFSYIFRFNSPPLYNISLFDIATSPLPPLNFDIFFEVTLPPCHVSNLMSSIRWPPSVASYCLKSQCPPYNISIFDVFDQIVDHGNAQPFGRNQFSTLFIAILPWYPQEISILSKCACWSSRLIFIKDILQGQSSLMVSNNQIWLFLWCWVLPTLRFHWFIPVQSVKYDVLKLSIRLLKADDGTIHHHHCSNKLLLVDIFALITMITLCFGTPNTHTAQCFCNISPCDIHLMTWHLPLQFLSMTSSFYGLHHHDILNIHYIWESLHTLKTNKQEAR